MKMFPRILHQVFFRPTSRLIMMVFNRCLNPLKTTEWRNSQERLTFWPQCLCTVLPKNMLMFEACEHNNRSSTPSPLHSGLNARSPNHRRKTKSFFPSKSSFKGSTVELNGWRATKRDTFGVRLVEKKKKNKHLKLVWKNCSCRNITALFVFFFKNQYFTQFQRQWLCSEGNQFNLAFPLSPPPAETLLLIQCHSEAEHGSRQPVVMAWHLF